MKIKFLQAYNGDSIWISFLENDIPRNIIIDGGIGDTYENNLKRKGDLFKVIEHIKNNEQKIDLLVMTHFDDDHIGGLLRWLNKDKEAPKLINKVWFNSGKEIAKELAIEENQDLNIEIKEGEEDFYTSTKQGIKFEEYLSKNQLWDGKIIKQGNEIDFLGLKFKILSPNIESLKNLLELYKKEEDYFTSSGEFDFETSLKDFIEEESNPKFKFKEDKSIPNGSSIAFVMECQGKNFLFLGDAYPSVVIEGLNKFDIDKENFLQAELIKISHHGSKHNTNSELLSIIKTDNYFISSNATKHGLPNKRTVARIIKNNQNANIHFNYDIGAKIITDEDFNDFEYFKISTKNEFNY